MGARHYRLFVDLIMLFLLLDVVFCGKLNAGRMMIIWRVVKPYICRTRPPAPVVKDGTRLG